MRPEFVSPPTLYEGRRTSTRPSRRRGATRVRGGACPLNESGEVVALGDYDEQARVASRNLKAALEEAGSGLDRVLKSTVYVSSTDRAQLVRVWSVVEEAFAPAGPPSTLLGVAALGYEGQLVEIEAVALV